MSKDKTKAVRKSVLREWVEAIIVAAALAVFVRTFFFQVYKIPTTSMVHTLMPGDQIFVNKLVFGSKIPFTSLRTPGFRKPRRGEVVVFIPPNEVNNPWFTRKAYIKRLIGLPGETISIKEGNIYVNGKEVVDAPITNNYYYNQGDYGAKGAEILVPEGKYFFLGDNSISSLDSRYWGFADEKEIIGKAIFIWWPVNRVAMVE